MQNLSSQNENFLQRIYREIEDNLKNEHYSVEDLASSVGLSRSMLHRKLKKLAGKSAHELIVLKRLEKARDLLENDVGTASEVAYQVGFSSPSYFSKVFKKHYKVSPGDFRKKPERYAISPTHKIKIKTPGNKKLLKYIWPVFAAGILLFIFFTLNTWNSLPFKERDWIVISDFDNQTGEPIFDNSLNTAFNLSISQSRYVNAISRKRMLEALKRMKKKDQVYIDEATGREIAIREDVNICIVPGISRIGSRYILTAKIVDAESSEVLKSEVIYTKGKDDIIKQMDNLTRRIRRSLGESALKISRNTLPLSKVTTSSLDALKQFSLGLDCHINMEFDEAVRYYENALEIDSSFTAAKVSLGNILFEKFDRERGLELLNQVMISIDDLTVRERYSILAKYSVIVNNDLDKAIDYTRSLLEFYPDDPTAYNNIGWYYKLKGEYDQSVKNYKLAIKIDPYTMIAYGGLIWVYLEHLGQLDSVIYWSKEFIEYGPENPWGYFYLGSAYAGMDSLNKAEDALLHAMKLDPDLLNNLYRLAHVYFGLNKHRKAIEILEDISYMGDQNVLAHYYIGLNYDKIGDREKAKRHYLKFHSVVKKMLEAYPDNPLPYIQTGLVLTRLGKNESALRIGQKALGIDSTVHFEIATLLAAQGKKKQALEALEKSIQNGYGDVMWIKLNPDLYCLHNELEYRYLIKKYFQ